MSVSVQHLDCSAEEDTVLQWTSYLWIPWRSYSLFLWLKRLSHLQCERKSDFFTRPLFIALFVDSYLEDVSPLITKCRAFVENFVSTTECMKFFLWSFSSMDMGMIPVLALIVWELLNLHAPSVAPVHPIRLASTDPMSYSCMTRALGIAALGPWIRPLMH